MITAHRGLLVTVFFAATVAAPGQRGGPPKPAPRGLPDGPGKDIVQRVCGATCHGPEIVAGKGYSRDGWTNVMNGMVARGAKADANEFGQIIEYLAKNLPPRSGSAGAGGAGFIGAGPDDAHIVDGEAAAKGKVTYMAECASCHGEAARGGKADKTDLVRSLVVLKDRYGATIGGFLKNKKHPLTTGRASASIQGAELLNLSHFLHLKVTDTLRSGPYSQPVKILTGDAKAGEAYFNGAGGCNKCHSVTGDLAGIGRKYEPVMLQQKFLFPRTFGFGRGATNVKPPKPVTLTVTTPDGKTVSGVLAHLDDFNVALRDASGEYHSWARTASLKVVKNDPYAGHIALLDKYTDKNMHDIVAYLESIK